MPFMITNSKCFIENQHFLIDEVKYNFNNDKEFTLFLRKNHINIILTESEWNNIIYKKLKQQKINFNFIKDKNTNSTIFKIYNFQNENPI